MTVGKQSPQAATAATAGRIRVLFVANDPPESAVYRYRCENLARVLSSEHFDAEVVSVQTRRVRVNHDIVVLHRICNVIEGQRYEQAARRCGAALVYGADDLVFDPDAFAAAPHSPLAAETRDYQRLRRYAPLHAAMLQKADAVLVSTEFLADAARRVGGPNKPVAVVRNFLSDELLALSNTAAALALNGKQTSGKKTVTFGYGSGTPTHDGDLAVVAAPLRETLQNFPDTDILLIGPVQMPLEWEALESEGRVRRQEFVLWRDLPAVLAEGDVNLAPLDLWRPLNEGKSEIKLLEAGAVGVPTIASASAGFQEALRGSKPGTAFLAADADEWRVHLTNLARDPALRSDTGRAALHYVQTRATAAAHQAELSEIFTGFAALPRTRPMSLSATLVGHPCDPKYLLKKWLRQRK